MDRNSEINDVLYRKMESEFMELVEKIKQMSSEETIKHSYEYVIKTDILLSLEYNDLPYEHAKALLSSKSPLEDIYQSWSSRDCTYMDRIAECIEEKSTTLIKEARKKSSRER